MENGGFGGGVFWGYVWELLFWSLLKKKSIKRNKKA
jgi:hypothetical protein